MNEFFSVFIAAEQVPDDLLDFLKILGGPTKIWERYNFQVAPAGSLSGWVKDETFHILIDTDQAELI